MGTTLIALVGMVHFKEPATAWKMVFMALVVAGVVGLNLAGRGRG